MQVRRCETIPSTNRQFATNLQRGRRKRIKSSLLDNDQQILWLLFSLLFCSKDISFNMESVDIVFIFMKYDNIACSGCCSTFTTVSNYCVENWKCSVKSLYRKYYYSRTPNNKTSGVQGEAGFQQEAWGHETACTPSKWSQVHGHISPPANLLLPLPWVYLVSFYSAIMSLWHISVVF